MNPTLLIVAPDNYAVHMERAFHAHQFETVAIPAIATVPNPVLGTSANKILAADYVIFTSRRAIEAFHRVLAAVSGSSAHHRQTQFCAIGRDNEALRDIGLTPGCPEAAPSLHGIVEALHARGDLGKSRVAVLGPKVIGLDEPDTVPDFLAELRPLCREVKRYTAYTTQAASAGQQERIGRLLESHEADAVALASATEAQVLRDIIGSRTELLEGVTVACFGPYTAKCARQCGLPIDFVNNNFGRFEDFARNLRHFLEHWK